MTDRRLPLLALAAICVGAATTLPYRHLWEPDEPRYCESAREMLATGDWLVPRINGEPYGHKPPLYMWLVAVGRLARLPWTAAGVLPSLLPFLALLLLLPGMARDFRLSPPAGGLAAPFLAASLLAALMALAARMDTLLAFLFTVSLWLTARLVWGDGKGASVAHLALWLCLAVAVLTKGPVVLALFGLTLGLTWAVARPRPALRPIVRGFGPLLGMAVILVWLIPAALHGGADYLREILIRQSAGRLVDSFAHQRPFYYHLITYPITGLPFAVLAFTAAVAALRERRSHPRLLLAAAMIAVLGFFTLISGKLVVYLLPLFPAAALLAADAVVERRGFVRWGLYAGAAGMTLVGIVVVLAPYRRAELAAVPLLLGVAGGGVAALGVWALVGLRRKVSPAAVAMRLTLAGLLVPTVIATIAVYALDPTMHLATVAKVLHELEPSASDGFVYRMNVAGPSLYTRRIFRQLATPKEFREAIKAGRAVLVEEKHWRTVHDQLADIPVSMTSFPFRTGQVLVVRADSEQLNDVAF